jgi:hypothetical protein
LEDEIDGGFEGLSFSLSRDDHSLMLQPDDREFLCQVFNLWKRQTVNLTSVFD